MAVLALCGGFAISALPARGVEASSTFKAGALTVVAPWARATPKGASTAAAYLTVVNAGDAADVLTAASTRVAGRSSPHEMTTSNGVMAMRPLASVVVPAHGRVTFRPGGIHLMLEQLKQPLKPGESFEGTLTFAKAGAVPVTFTVAPVGASGPTPSAGMTMDGGTMD